MYKKIKTFIKSRRPFYLLPSLILVLFMGRATWTFAQSTGQLAACVNDGNVKQLGLAENVVCNNNETRLTWHIADDQTLSLVGSVLSIEDGNSVDLSTLQDGVDDADADPANELNSAVALNGTTLEVTDAGGTLAADLSSLQDGVDDADADSANELNNAVTLNGTTLEVTDAGGTLSADLSRLQDGVNDADANATNELNSAVTFNGTTLEITDAGGVKSADLSTLQNRILVPQPNLVNTADDSGAAGFYTDITVGADGLPLISYLDASHFELKVAHCDDLACTNVTSSTVDDGEVGEYSALIVGADGLPLISYYDSVNGSLKVAHCDDVACTNATNITLDSVGTFAEFGSAITVGTDGLPLISYYDADDTSLKAAHCDDVACTSFNTAIVDSVSFLGGSTAVTLGVDGLPIISYYEFDNEDMKVAHCNNLVCSTATITIVDSGVASFRGSTDIALGVDGLPIISYYHQTKSDLKVAHCDNATCTNFTITTLDSAGFVGEYNAIVMGADGLPLISYDYQSGGNRDLRVAHCNDVACTSAASLTVDSTQSAGEYNAITIGVNGLPIISYQDSSHGHLKVLHCANVFCVPYLR